MQVAMDPSERKKPLTLNLPPMILEELTEAAWQHRCSKSVLAERAIRAYLKLDDTKPAAQDRQAITAAQAEAIARFTVPGNIGAGPQPAPTSPSPLTDLQRIENAKAGRYGGQLDTEWPDALERSVPPLELSA